MSTAQRPRLSFEFFPPKTPTGRKKLAATLGELNQLGPNFFSVTYGAGGSTRDTTRDVVREINEADIAVAPHLSFGGHSEREIAGLLDEYQQMGISRLVTLRGDVPSGMGGASQLSHADELVSFVRQQCGDHFTIDVAAYPEIHPEASSYSQDIRHLKGKFDAGANSAITQYFYNADAYFYFLDRCMDAGITQPIYAGVMPIINFANLQRFSTNCGAEIPRWIAARMCDFENDPESIQAFAADVVSQLCDTLLSNGAPGIHFYTMNQAAPTRVIWDRLKLSSRQGI
ncbi:MAG: methylenetetrahydrofolate reductase (NADPH) [Halieaceae bacterium]